MPVCLGVGSGLYFFIDDLPLLLIQILFGLTLTGLLWNFLKARNYFIYGFLFILLGFCIVSLKSNYLATPFIDKTYKDIDISGTIESLSDREEGSKTIVLQDIDFPDIDIEANLSKVRLTLKESTDQPLEIGAHIEAIVTLFPVRGPVYPGSLDLRRKYFFEGISAQGVIKEIKSHHNAQNSGALQQVEQLRRRITETFYQRIPGEEGAIAAALVTGERSKISQKTRQAFVDAGIAHILAISGLHLSIIAGFVFFFVRGGMAAFPSIVERLSIKKIAAGISIMFTFLYLLISGVGYPSIRAFVMTGIVMLGIIVDRRAISMRTLAISAFLIILIYPECVVSASFQLSFSAVVALIAFYEAFWHPYYEWTRAGGYIRKTLAYPLGVVASTVVATIATTPLIIFLFNRFTLQAILGNLLAIPLTGFLVMPAAFFATVTQIFGTFELFFLPFKYAVKALVWVAYFTTSFPGSAILVPSPPLWFPLLMVSGVLWLCLWHGRVRLFGLLPMAASFMAFFFSHPPDILLSDKTIGVYQDGELMLSSDKGWYEKVMWMRHLGVGESDLSYWEENVYEASEEVILIHNPRDLSYKELKDICFTPAMNVLLTNGYVDRVCRNLKPYNNTSKQAKKLISRVDLAQGVMAIWLDPFRIQHTADVDRGKPWGHGGK